MIRKYTPTFDRNESGYRTQRADVTHLVYAIALCAMVIQTERDDMTWYKCEGCGLMFDEEEDARQHEENCDSEDPSYIQ